MKIWKIILGFLGLVGGLFAVNATKSKKVKELKKVIKENKKEEKKVEKKIKELEEAKTASKKEVGNKIGNVRGKGLFLGIEFVNDRQTLEPATKLTSLLCSRLKDRHNILTSIDGPHNNVIVIKPPLCFSQDNARYLVKKIEFELQSITDADIIDNFTHTAT